MMINSVTRGLGLFTAANMDVTAVQILGGSELAGAGTDGRRRGGRRRKRRAGAGVDREPRARSISADAGAACARDQGVLPAPRPALHALHHRPEFPRFLPARRPPNSASEGISATMGLLNPGALYYLLALIPALATRLPRARASPPRSRLQRAGLPRAAVLRGRRFGGWPRLDWMFFVEMLIIAWRCSRWRNPMSRKRAIRSPWCSTTRPRCRPRRAAGRADSIWRARALSRCAGARRPGRGHSLSDRAAASSRRSAIRERGDGVGGARTVASRRRTADQAALTALLSNLPPTRAFAG